MGIFCKHPTYPAQRLTGATGALMRLSDSYTLLRWAEPGTAQDVCRKREAAYLIHPHASSAQPIRKTANHATNSITSANNIGATGIPASSSVRTYCLRVCASIRRTTRLRKHRKAPPERMNQVIIALESPTD